MTHRLEESAGLGGRVTVKSDREVRPTKGGEELEAGRGQRSDPYRVNERIGNQELVERSMPVRAETGETGLGVGNCSRDVRMGGGLTAELFDVGLPVMANSARARRVSAWPATTKPTSTPRRSPSAKQRPLSRSAKPGSTLTPTSPTHIVDLAQKIRRAKSAGRAQSGGATAKHQDSRFRAGIEPKLPRPSVPAHPDHTCVSETEHHVAHLAATAGPGL
jgi:hypothetical protein